ncbi:dolichyl-phosphate beta-glucosyltransferase [Diaporthe australafricana]|uniref:dolichyl-phosphate beta-glucosyltransferase n=1 Tax=Diaporthe australafricana TaxID=127596 RepID=A0ABR3XF04_9PEZI
MADSSDPTGLLAAAEQLVWSTYMVAREFPFTILPLILIASVSLVILAFLIGLHIIAPKPRAPLPSEKTYITTTPDGITSRSLPCWFDRWDAERKLSEAAVAGKDAFDVPDTGSVEPASVEVSVVIPAYNEEKRILPALEEAVVYLDAKFGRPSSDDKKKRIGSPPTTPHHRQVFRRTQQPDTKEGEAAGYEIIIVNDGSRDKTVEVALDFSRRHNLHDILRVVNLEKNRGKGGAVTHGLRHVRGQYAVFADADGASKFSDLGRLVEGCEDVVDASNRGVAIGSRGHLVGSDQVVQRSALRNFLMKSFHFVLMILTPPATSRIRDTQCGFKLFSRAALPHIVPYMHMEGWIFDIEMLMLAESAPPAHVIASDGTVIGLAPGIRVAEVPIDWHEVEGTKMNIIKDSIGMALGMVILRGSWMFGVYRRRIT